VTTVAAGADTFSVFGTTATLLVSEPGRVEAARLIADAELAVVDLACSRFRPDSELSRLNAAGGAVTRVSSLFADLIEAALRAARLTDGDVDPTCGQALNEIGYDRDFAVLQAARHRPATGRQTTEHQTTGGQTTGRQTTGRQTTGRQTTGRQTTGRQTTGRQTAGHRAPDGPAARVPGWRSVRLDRARLLAQLSDGAQLDLGATAKAWAADRCAELIAGQTGSGVLVSLGGDIAVAGPPPAGGWRVRVTDDHAAGPDAPGQTVTIRSGGLATSSTTVRAWAVGGQRMHHIINPATGEPARSCWRTVSVAAASCVDANTASTAAIIRGAAAVSWLRDAGLPARLVREDGSVETTGGWPDDPGPTEPG
jgi:thiamine biosynthesis lipoprotein